jgi:glycosyltransferase involved in cell wall biosynthesis
MNSPTVPRRVAFITSQAFSLVNFRGPLIREMRQRGIEVFALAPDFDANTRAALERWGVHPISFPLSRAGMNPVADAYACFVLACRLRKIRPDAVVAYFIKPVIYGLIAAAVARVPRRFALIEGLGYAFASERENTMLTRVVSVLYRVSLRAAQRVFVLNDDDLQTLVSRAGLARNVAVKLDGIGVDLETFASVPLPSGPPVFLLVARMIREKGITDFVAAARLLRTTYPAVRFIMAGGLDANPTSIRHEEIEAWVAEGLIEWPGQVPDIRLWIGRASVFVLPSYYREGLPRSTQEAMAMGRAVITTDWIGCRETVQPEVNGFLVPVRNPEALAAAMRRCIEQPERVIEMGRMSRRIAVSRFDVHVVNRRILNVIGFE